MWPNNNLRADVTNKFYHNITMPCRNKALWWEISQWECFISGCSSYVSLKFDCDIGSGKPWTGVTKGFRSGTNWSVMSIIRVTVITS